MHHRSPLSLVTSAILLLALTRAAGAAECPGECSVAWPNCPGFCKQKRCNARKRKWVVSCPNGNCHGGWVDVHVPGWRCVKRTCGAQCTAEWPACDAHNCRREPCGVVNGTQRWHCRWKEGGCTTWWPTCPPGSTARPCWGSTSPETYRCDHVHPNETKPQHESTFASGSGTGAPTGKGPTLTNLKKNTKKGLELEKPHGSPLTSKRTKLMGMNTERH